MLIFSTNQNFAPNIRYLAPRNAETEKTHVSWRHYHPESLCASGKFFAYCYEIHHYKHAKMHIFLDGLETFRMIWKLSGWSIQLVLNINSEVPCLQYTFSDQPIRSPQSGANNTVLFISYYLFSVIEKHQWLQIPNSRSFDIILK